MGFDLHMCVCMLIQKTKPSCLHERRQLTPHRDLSEHSKHHSTQLRTTISIHRNYSIKLCVRALKRNGLMVAFCTTVLVAVSNDTLVQLSVVQATRGKPQNRG